MGRGLFEPWHIVVVVVVVALLFGWKKLPDISRSVGRSMRIFKSEVSEMKNDGKDTASTPSPAASETVPGGVVPPQPQYAPPPQAQYAPPPQAQYAPPPQPQYAPPPQAQYAPPPQPQYAPPSDAATADQARRDNPAL